jgi:hypothetical protein
MSFAGAVAYLLQIIAAELAWRVRRVKSAHRHVAKYLAIIAIADPLRAGLGWLVLRPAREALGPRVPYRGFARWVFHADQGLFLVGPLGLAIVATLVFLGLKAPRMGHMRGVFVLLLVALAVSYPNSPGAAYEAWRGLWWPGVITGAHALEQLVAWGLAIWWLRRNPGGWADESGKILMALAAADLALWLAGVLPGTAGEIAARWHLGDAARASILAWICWEQVAWLRSTMQAPARQGS